MDHLKFGKTMKHYVYPPSIPSDEEIRAFGDGLKDTIPTKWEELLLRLEQLKKERRQKLKFIRQKTKKGSDEEWFLALLAEHEFSEGHVIKRWLRYWLAIEKRLNNRVSRPESRGKDKLDVEAAKQRSLESLYEGKLKRSGFRMTGLCPFHEERTPSFFIFPDNHYHCYGCGAHGDSISFVMRLKNLNFVDAVRYLL